VAIARAHAAVNDHPDFACTAVPGAVTVFVIPDLPPGDELAAPRPDPGAIEAVRRHLDVARLITQEVYVLGPSYLDVDLRVTAGGEPVDAAEARASIDRRIRTYLHPLWGGDDGRGWPFGGPLRPSALIRRLQEAVGGDLRIESVEIRVGDPARAFESCEDVAIQPHALVKPRVVEVRFAGGETAAGVLS